MSGAAGLVVMGAGGHAKVVVATLLDLGLTVSAVLDDDPGRQGGRLLGLTVAGPIAGSPTAGQPAILAVGDNAVRRRMGSEMECRWQTVVHPTAYVHASVRLGEGTFVAAGAVIQPDVTIGPHCIVNTGATIDHDCVVGGCAHIAPGAHLAGNVRLGEGALVGLGAGITPGVSIGDWAVLGAGATAVSDLADRATAIGVSARARGDD